LLVKVARVDLETSRIVFILAQSKDLPSEDAPMMPSFTPLSVPAPQDGGKKTRTK
jgi:hypothetical protein